MDTAAQVLLIIVSVVLVIFLIILAIATVYLIKLLATIRRMTERADNVASSVEAAAQAFGKAAGPVAILKVLGKLVSFANKSRKDK